MKSECLPFYSFCLASISYQYGPRERSPSAFRKERKIGWTDLGSFICWPAQSFILEHKEKHIKVSILRKLKVLVWCLLFIQCFPHLLSLFLWCCVLAWGVEMRSTGEGKAAEDRAGLGSQSRVISPPFSGMSSTRSESSDRWEERSRPNLWLVYRRETKKMTL